MKPGIAKLLVAVLALVFLDGCASSAPPLPPSLDLPTPVNDLRAVRKGDKVYLNWTIPSQTTDHLAIRHPGRTLICRSPQTAMNACGTPAGEMPPSAAPGKKPLSRSSTPEPNITAFYIDNPPITSGTNLDAEFTYAVEVLNQNQRSAGLSNQVHVPALPAVPPPTNFAATATADGIRLTWACPSSSPQSSGAVQYHLRIYRRLAGTQTDVQSAEPNLSDCQGPAVLDQTFEWEKTYLYRAAVVTIVSAPGKPVIEVEGDDTASVKLFAHDVFPPSVPAGVQAVFSGAGQPLFIDLVWTPDTDADLAGYNVYRHEQGGQPEKLNSQPVKTPAYRDSAVRAGTTYFYSVSAVDARGNESAKSEEASEVVP